MAGVRGWDLPPHPAMANNRLEDDVLQKWLQRAEGGEDARSQYMNTPPQPAPVPAAAPPTAPVPQGSGVPMDRQPNPYLSNPPEPRVEGDVNPTFIQTLMRLLGGMGVR